MFLKEEYVYVWTPLTFFPSTWLKHGCESWSLNSILDNVAAC